MKKFTAELWFADNAEVTHRILESRLETMTAHKPVHTYCRPDPIGVETASVARALNGYVCIAGPHLFLGPDDDVEDDNPGVTCVEDLNDAQIFTTPGAAFRYIEAWLEQEDS